MLFRCAPFLRGIPACAVALFLAAPHAFSQQVVPVITNVSAGLGTTTNTNIAPGSIITVIGSNLAAADADLSSFAGTELPRTLGGVQVLIDGIAAPLFVVSATKIVGQVPFEVPLGSRPLAVTNGASSTSAFNVTIAPIAPAWLADASGPIIVKASDYSLVGAANPAKPGDILLIYATGLGQTTPPLATGMFASSSTLSYTPTVTATIGGQSAPVFYSVASPGFAGLYQIALQVPAAAGGTLPITFQTGATAAAPATLITGILRGSQVDPQLQAVIAQYQALAPIPIDRLTPQEARQQPSFADAVKALLVKQRKSTAPQPVASVKDMMIPGGAGQIPARVYSPAGRGPFPVVVFFHGGGFVIATIDTYDASARELANAAEAIVVSVEYRKAPENKFPAATEDAYAAVQWVINNAASINGRGEKVAVDGESAGGNLATVVCLMARDRMGKMPLYQVLVYPVTNLASESPTYEENGNAPFLTRAALRWFGGYYLNGPQDALNPYASPLLGNLNGLPPATVITDGFDPLRDEGAAYADKLRQAGISVDYRNYESATHEFFGMAAVADVARQAVQQVAADLKAAFAQ